MATSERTTIVLDYQDQYVEPIILDALRKNLMTNNVSFADASAALQPQCKSLQWRSYESIDFFHALAHHTNNLPQLINAYVIRKALIRKHYLAHTILSHVTKNPSSILKRAFPTTIDFELDYAEFLDDALVEAFELRESFERNEENVIHEREWWILKPSMSDRGQGIRLFSTEDELRHIFEAWEAELPDSDEEGDMSDEEHILSEYETNEKPLEGIVTSHLRHFVAQRYIEKPLLIAQSPFQNRKFHIRAYIVAAGALKVYVYDQMLALFASEAYRPPWETEPKRSEISDDNDDDHERLKRMRDVHLTNTCVQSADNDHTVQQDSVFLLSSLPLLQEQQDSINTQICTITSEMFRAALAHPTNFQPMPQAFEVFGVDFLCSEGSRASDGSIDASLLEVNAFPDFAQTGEDLKDVVVARLFEEIVRKVVSPMLKDPATSEEPAWNASHHKEGMADNERGTLQLVLDVDAGRK